MNGVAIIFDLDGTLVDTAPDLRHAANHVLALRGLPAVPPEVIRPVAGRGATRMIEAAFAAHGRRLSESELAALTGDFLAFYSANIAVDSRPFPGVEDALAELARRGARLGVCTNKRAAFARQVLAALNLERCFAAVLGGDSLPVRKPHPGHLLGAIAAVGGSPEAAVMVGDSAPDIEAAKAASVPVIAVGFGYAAGPVEGLAPDRVISHFGALAVAVESLLRPGSLPVGHSRDAS